LQIVSGSYGREKVHYEVPSAAQVPDEMARLIDWHNQTGAFSGDRTIHGIARAGIAHLWFEVKHPFDDGNGRVGRPGWCHGYSLKVESALKVEYRPENMKRLASAPTGRPAAIYQT